jgi:hypothetical protein
MATNNTSNNQERRQNAENRQIFEGVYDRVEPFLDPESTWVGQPLEPLAYNVLREKYPNMTDEELNAYFTAAKRVFGERKA